MKAINHNNNHPFSFALVKFAVCFLLLGLVYRLFYSSFVPFAPVAVTDTPFIADNPVPQPPAVAAESETEPSVSVDSPANVENQTSENAPAKCNVFVGDWVPDMTGPPYTNSTCPFIENHQNCMGNGRPDTGYFYWKWSPRDCDLLKFDPRKFLDMMRDKTLAFIGDSIMRNHVQSLLCTCSQVEKALEVYHDEQYRSKRWYFPTHRFTLSVVWSPFLTKASIFEDSDGVSTDIIQLHLDELDTVWTEQFENFDYVVVAGGKWFLKSAIYYEDNKIVGCHNCAGKNITEIGFAYAYRKALNSTLKFITSSKHRVYTFFRTTTPDHFENGQWDNGGYCNRSEPFKEGEIDINDVDEHMHGIEVEEFEMATAIAEKGLTIKLFDTMHLSLLRPDGHPGAYRQFQPFSGSDKNVKVQNDCLHWCLPGPIDAWNDLMMHMLVSS